MDTYLCPDCDQAVIYELRYDYDVKNGRIKI